MRRSLAISAAALAFVMAGCSGSEEMEPPPTPTPGGMGESFMQNGVCMQRNEMNQLVRVAPENCAGQPSG